MYRQHNQRDKGRGSKIKGGLTTLLMRGSIAMKNFSMLVFRITSVITLQEEQAHHVIELESGGPESAQSNPGDSNRAREGERGRTYSRRATLGRFGSPGR